MYATAVLGADAANVEGIEKKVEEAKKEVAEAEKKVEKAKEEVAEAKKEVAKAETKKEKEFAKKMRNIAVRALETALKDLETSVDERKSQVRRLNDVLNELRHAELQTHQAAGATPAADTGAAGEEIMGLEMKIQQLTLDLALERQRAEQESQRAEQESQRAEQESQRAEQESQRAELLRWKTHILTTRGPPLLDEVYGEFTAYVKNKQDWLRAGESAPTCFMNETASVSSSSTGSNASKVPFPNDWVDSSSWSVESEEVPDFLQPLLWKLQQRLASMYGVFGTSPMSEVDFLQPVIQAFFIVVVEQMGLNKCLKVVHPGDGVMVNVDWSGSQARGSPDIVLLSTKNAGKGYWNPKLTVSERKLCRAVFIGEVKKSRAAVMIASEDQARWYHFGTSECLSPKKFFSKGQAFGGTRTCFCTDGFCWRFTQSNGVPQQAGTKWCVAASDLLDQSDDIVLYLTHILKSYVVEVSTKFKEGISDDGSKEGGSLGGADWIDEDSNDSALFCALASSDDAEERNYQQHGEGYQRGMTSQKSQKLFVTPSFGTPSSLLQRCSSASESDTVRKRTFHVRGDGLPKGLDTTVFVAMQSRERVLAFLGM